MKSEYLAYFPATWLPGVALVLFLAVFAGALIWVNRRSSNELYRKLSNLPLE